MTGRKRTLRWILAGLALWLCGGVALLVGEFAAVARQDSSTISEIFWSAWAAQPGAFVALLLPLTFALGVLAGHFVWQSSVVYRAAQQRIDLDAALDLALDAREEFVRKGRPALVCVSSQLVRELDPILDRPQELP